eukprot:175838_1
MPPGRPRKNRKFGGGQHKSNAKKLAQKKGYWKRDNILQAEQQNSNKAVDIDPCMEASELTGKYKIIHQIGRGGYGTVYKAVQLSTNNFVAVKRIQSANVSLEPGHHPCMEAQILYEFQEFKHFPMMREILVDNKSGTYSIIMDYFEHDAFNTYNNVLNEYDTIKYIYILLNCINLLCIKGYIHRDIKPGNFLYSHKYKTYLLIDFGLCQTRKSISKQYQKDI